MRLTRLALAAAALLAVPAAQAGALLDIYQKALTSDQTLQAASFQRDAALQARPLALSAFLPQIGGQASYTLQDGSSERSASEFGDTSGVTFKTDQSSDARALSLSLSQAVFNWEALKRLKQSDNQVALAETGYRAAAQQLVLRVAQAYFNVLAARDFTSFAETENKAVSRQLEQSQQRFEVGLSAITDVQEAQARFDLTVAQKIDAETQLTSAERVLAEITGLPENRVAAVIEDFPLGGPDPASPEQWVEAAKANNLNVLSSRLIAAIAEDDIKIARARHLPTVALEGGYSNSSGNTETTTSSRGQSVTEESPTKSDGTRIGIVARIPIFSGFAVRTGVRSATATYEQRVREFASTTRVAERQTGDAYQGVVAGISRVKALKAAVKSAQTALEASQVGLQVGARTSIDVLNAQREVSNAQRNYSLARYNYLLSVLSLKLSAGRLLESDLAEIDRLLTTG